MLPAMRSQLASILMAVASLPAAAWASAPSTATTIKRSNPALPGVVYHGPRDQKRIALTFDACSSKKSDKIDQKVVDELIALDVPATMFLGGKWMSDEAEAMARLRAVPNFELATHGYMHPHLLRLTSNEIQDEVARAEAEFEEHVGRKPDLMRAPYGELDARVVKLLVQDGLTPVQFDLPGADSTFSKKTLVKWVTGQAKPGSIVVLHMNGHGKHTAEALPEIVENLRRQGYTFVTVGQLLGHDAPQVAEPILRSIQPVPMTLDDGPMCAIGGDVDP